MNHLSDSQCSYSSYQSSSTTGSSNQSYASNKEIQQTSKEILAFLASLCKPRIKFNYHLVDLYQKYKSAESPPQNFLDLHRFTSKHRTLLLDNICTILNKYDVNFSTHAICCGILDLYFKKAEKPIDPHLQNLLILCCCMIGSKFNDVSYLKLNILSEIFEKYLRNHKFDEDKQPFFNKQEYK